MTEPDLLEQAATLIRRLALRPGHQDEAEAWLAAYRRYRLATEGRPFVFSSEGAFIWLGWHGEHRPVPNPRLGGLDDAFRVFIAGVNANACLVAEDFGASANALRNRLSGAATWAEAQGAGELARAIRSIEIGRDGRITYNPAAHSPLILAIDWA